MLMTVERAKKIGFRESMLHDDITGKAGTCFKLGRLISSLDSKAHDRCRLDLLREWGRLHAYLEGYRRLTRIARARDGEATVDRARLYGLLESTCLSAYVSAEVAVSWKKIQGRLCGHAGR